MHVDTDTDVDTLVSEFLTSDYVSDEYLNWQLDRRIERFLQHRGLGQLADDGDSFNFILDRVMSHVSHRSAATLEHLPPCNVEVLAGGDR
jgi:hypothetical protein